MGGDAGHQGDDRFAAPAERWDSDHLIWRAEDLAAERLGHEGEGDVYAVTLRELARRYRVAIANERARWEAARRAFGEGIGR